jgi:hypothetical protein
LGAQIFISDKASKQAYSELYNCFGNAEGDKKMPTKCDSYLISVPYLCCPERSSMDKKIALKFWIEGIWWVISLMLVYAVLYPVHKAMYVWPFQTWNIIFILVLLTFARYTFLLPHTFLARVQILKIALILAMFPLTFALVSGLNGFLTYIEENTWDGLTGHLPAGPKRSIESYLWTEMIFFGAGSIIVSPVFAVRLFLSIWRQHNRGTV